MNVEESVMDFSGRRFGKIPLGRLGKNFTGNC
jgi:hypothetical protein